MTKPIIIFGTGNLGEVAYNILEANQIVVYGFLEESEELIGQTINEVTVLGQMDDHGFLKLIGQKCDCCVVLSDKESRKGAVEMLIEKRKTMPINTIHPNVLLPKFHYIEHGNIIDGNCHIGASSKIGSHNIIHAGCLIGANVKIGNFVEVGMGSNIGYGAKIHDDVVIGMGSTISPNLTIEKGAQIGPGSVVLKNVSEGQVMFGNPAKAV